MQILFLRQEMAITSQKMLHYQMHNYEIGDHLIVLRYSAGVMP